MALAKHAEKICDRYFEGTSYSDRRSSEIQNNWKGSPEEIRSDVQKLASIFKKVLDEFETGSNDWSLVKLSAFCYPMFDTLQNIYDRSSKAWPDLETSSAQICVDIRKYLSRVEDLFNNLIMLLITLNLADNLKTLDFKR